MTPSILCISLSPLGRASFRKAGEALSSACCRVEVSLAVIFPAAATPAVALPMLRQPLEFLRYLKKTPCGTGSIDSETWKAAVLAETDRCIRAFGPDAVALFQDPEQSGKIDDLTAFLRSQHPGIRILGFDSRGRGQWLTSADDFSDDENPSDEWQPLDSLLNSLGRPTEQSGPEDGSTWPAAGPVAAVWPGAFTSPGRLARMLDRMMDRMQLPDARSGPRDEKTGLLFMAGSRRGDGTLDELAGYLDPWLARKPEETGFGIQLPVSGKLEPEKTLSLMVRFRDKGLKLVNWLLDEPGAQLPRPLLWQVSKMGVWNHVSGTNLSSGRDDGGQAAWLANNPNIVHSLESMAPPWAAGWKAPGLTEIPLELLSYGKLPPLPGRPFWQLLGDAPAILAARLHMDAKRLFRLRADADSPKMFSLGTGLVYQFKKPGDLDRQTMDEIVAMVDAGGSVDITHVRANLEKAYLIAYATENGVIVGNSSLKHPRQVFIDRLRGITGLDFTHFVERGYTSVRPEYRAMGIGAKLLEGLTRRATDVKVFSLISEDNLATQKIAIRNRTRKIAVYFSDKLGKEMGVWMPEEMIDEGWELDL